MTHRVFHPAVLVLSLLLPVSCTHSNDSSQPPHNSSPAKTVSTSSGTDTIEPATWSSESAQRYLSERSDQWFSQRSCALSCHTTHPFMIADLPVDKAGAALREEILKEVRTRVIAWPKVDLWYEMDADKVAQSRGTESVLNAFALTQSEGSQSSDIAIRALANMMSEQRPDGSWAWLDFSLAPWELADAEVGGASLAVIALGRSKYQVSPAKLDRLREYFQRNKDAHFHNKLMMLWASSELSGIVSQENAVDFTKQVRAVQLPDGGYSIGSLGPWKRRDGTSNDTKTSDAYGTAFVAYVLAKIGRDENQDTIVRAKAWLKGQQLESGAWAGRSLNRDKAFNASLMTDAATTFALMALVNSDD